MCVKLTFVIQV